MSGCYLPPSFGRAAAVCDAPSCAPVAEQPSTPRFATVCALLLLAGFFLLARSSASAQNLTGLSCATSSFTGSGTDTCTVTINSAFRWRRNDTVRLASSDSAVTVPASVTIADRATSATFTATVSAVSVAQTATITASSGRVSRTFSLELNANAATSPAWTVQSTSVAFGDVTVKSTSTQSVAIKSTGTANLIISSGSATGTGFSISGLSYPATLDPGETATLNISFDPPTAATDTGSVTLASNAASNGTAIIALSGAGKAASYLVDLTWDAPSSSADPVAGYNIYRSSNRGASYRELTSSVTSSTSYTDSTVQSGASYLYYVVSVDGEGNTSGPSNTWSATIP